MRCDLLAVSYPGAQGDRCILSGGVGRKVLRTYIDIIAYQEKDGVATVFLQECKDIISKSISDAHKLNTLVEDEEKLKGLSILYRKTTNHETSLSLNIGIGAKYSPMPPAMNVDYIFMFSIDDSHLNKTIINYNAAIINTALVEDFGALANDNGKLIGYLELDKIYVVK